MSARHFSTSTNGTSTVVASWPSRPRWELSQGATDDESGAQVAISLSWPKGHRAAVLRLLAKEVMRVIVRVNDLAKREAP